jgi:hypothetical protein
MILAQVAVHRAADPSFECPKRHRTGVASLKSFVVIDPSRAVQPKLGDGDAMDRRIKLPITVFRSTHPPSGASGPVRNRGQTGMLRKRGLTGEAGYERGLAHDLRRRYRAAPRHSIEPRRYLAHLSVMRFSNALMSSVRRVMSASSCNASSATIPD